MGMSSCTWHASRVTPYRNFVNSRIGKKVEMSDMARNGLTQSLDRYQTESVNGDLADVRRRWVKHYVQWTEARFRDELSLLRQWVSSCRPKSFRDWFNLLVFNLFAMVVVTVSGIFTFESSTSELRNSLHTTVLFPMYIPHAVALAITSKYDNPVYFGNFTGFCLSRVYAAWRGTYLVSVGHAGVLVVASVLGSAEVSTAAFFLRRFLCRRGSQRTLPTIESITEAIQFVLTVLLSTLFFDTLIALVICISPLVSWSEFFRFWASSWMGVLAGMLTVAPAIMHFMAWKPRPSLFRPRKIFEAIILTAISTTLVVIMFITNVQAVIRPLPYLLFPIIILSAFRFNRLGCALLVVIICYVCSWASVRGRGAVYKMAGSPLPYSSPHLILQVELFVAVLGVVGILLSAAVREKKRLARDLYTMNEELESTVSQRTQELVSANEELKESQRKAEEASQAKSDFLANMSHEIRTPIHGIMGLTALVLDSELSADQRESLVSVKECANLLLHIINSILDLAKIEAGRVEVESVPFNIRQLVSSTVRMLTTRAQERKLDLLWEVDSSVPEWMDGDSGKIQQCLLNLVGNAVKFTHQGSVAVHVTVDVMHGMISCAAPKQPDEFQNQQKGLSSTQSTLSPLEKNMESTAINIYERPLEWQYLSQEKGSPGSQKLRNATVVVAGPKSVLGVPILFEVRDTGIGISSAKLQDIFTPFTQADASTSRVYGGTGLGLCIVQRFVELLGGKLLAESELGKGSAFKFCIPLGMSDTQTKESMDSPGVPEFCHLSPNEGQKSGSLGRTLSFLDIKGGDAEEAASLNNTVDPVNMKGCGNFEDHPPSVETNSENNKVSHSEIFGGVQGDAPMLWAPLQTMKSLDKWDSVLRLWNEGFKEDLGSNAREHPIHRSKSEDLNKNPNSCGFSPIPTNNEDTSSQPVDGAGHLKLQQPKLIQTSKPPFFTNGPLKCSVTVHSENRSNRDEEQHRRLIPEKGSHIVDTEVPSESQTQHLRGNVQYSSQDKGGKDASRTDDGWQKSLQLHVLLAEDNLINQKVATRQLKKHGHAVTVVGDGVGALDAVIANHDSFDLVLMDVQMPMMDGLEATKKIREVEVQQGWKRLPVLGLTAHAIQGYEDTCLSCGMDGYLGKPFDINQLLAVMDKYVVKR